MVSRGARGALLFAFAASFVAIVSCEAIVGDQIPQYTCDATSSKGCPPNYYCKGAGCAACEKVDVCDHLDNDCNGLIDDGKLCDADQDGYTWCGSLDSQGRPFNVDCDDNDPTIHPGAQEICDGKDNDCNGKVDDGAVCPNNQVCFDGQCISNPCNPASPTDCTQVPNQHCDSVSHTCVDNTGAAPGSPCQADAECDQTQGLFCVKASIIGSAVVPPNATGMCTTPCCASEDCKSSPISVCYAPGNGGRYCVDPTKIGRGSVGSEPAGTQEATASRCRSGAVANDHCIDTCCSDGNCSNGAVCAYGTFSGHDGFYCLPPGGSGGQWASCSSDGNCHDNACFDYGFIWGGHCISECCGSSSCGVVYDIVPARCYFETTQSGDHLGVCSQQQQGGGGVGQTCASSSDCMSGICYTDTSGQYCSDTCCVDGDCGNGFVCRPAPTFPRCVRKL